MSGHGYRSDIDGLRAVAVLAVVLYHAVPALAPGGFVGVDVFFVISGFLITRLIMSDIERGRFSVASFYVRRAKRILPALFVVLAATLALGLLLLTPTELARLGTTTAATAVFASNIAFWGESGYFDTAAESKPLLHTWSLAVEEQFYVLWPLTLLLLYPRRRAGAMLFGLIGTSFALSSYFTVVDQSTAFYLLPSRAWELLIGAALAMGLLPVPAGSRQRDAAALVGIAGIMAGVLLLDHTSSFPGWNALAPCLGTALVIAAGSRGENVLSRQMLSRPPVVFVGLISYSLYLWHWPLLTLARITERGPLPATTATIVVLVAVVLSILTWRFVETPLRARGVTPAAFPVLLRYSLGSAAALALGLYIQSTSGFLASARPEVQRIEKARYDINPRSADCLRWQSITGPLPGTECMSGPPERSRIVVWGDSHADAVTPGIVAWASANGYATHQLTMASCPPLVQIGVRGAGADYSPCREFNRQVMAYLESDASIEAVVLSARWTLYTENARFGDDPGPITFLVDDEERKLSSETSRRVFSRALEATVQALRRARRTVIVLGTIPALGVNVPDCLARNERPFSGVRSCDAEASQVRSHNAFADGEIMRIAGALPGVCVLLPERTICPDDRCRGTANGDILYANDDHLSVSGARFVAARLALNSCLPSRSAHARPREPFQE
jgi:peptidoglycan/LPS O-acetylase OafA/YrhL